MRDPEWDKMSERTRAEYIRILRSIPTGKRFEITADLCDMVREAMAAGIRSRRPGISDEEVRKELIRMTVHQELRRKAYGW